MPAASLGSTPPRILRSILRRLYRTGSLDAKDIQTARERFAFKDVAKDYRLIDDDGDPVVVANWEEKQNEIEVLLKAVRRRTDAGEFPKAGTVSGQPTTVRMATSSIAP